MVRIVAVKGGGSKRDCTHKLWLGIIYIYLDVTVWERHWCGHAAPRVNKGLYKAQGGALLEDTRIKGHVTHICAMHHF